MNSERKLVLGKIEAIPGTPVVPAAATDAFLAIDFKWVSAAKPVTDTFNYAAPYYGAGDTFTVSQSRECGFDIPVMGGALPLGTQYPAPILALYRACGHAAVSNGTTSVVINPVSAGEEAMTMVINEDGLLRRMVGARGSMKWAWAEGKVPRCSVAMMGLYSTPEALAMAAATMPTLQKPVGFNKTNTTISLGALNLLVKSFELDGGRTFEYRNLSGDESFVATDCQPKATVVFELPAIAQRNVYQDLETTLRQALTLSHGIAAGNRFAVNAPQAELVNLAEDKDRSRIFVTATFNLRPTAGADQYTITLT